MSKSVARVSQLAKPSPGALVKFLDINSLFERRQENALELVLPLLLTSLPALIHFSYNGPLPAKVFAKILQVHNLKALRIRASDEHSIPITGTVPSAPPWPRSHLDF